MSDYREPTITIEGTPLTKAQALTVRVACSDFALWLNSENALGDDEHGKAMRAGYLHALGGIFTLMAKDS